MLKFYMCSSSFEVLRNCPLPADALSLGEEAINQLWREKKIRAVGIKRANALVETAKTSVGMKNGINASRFEMSMLIEDYLINRADVIHKFQINSQGITSDNWNLKYPALSEIEIPVSNNIEEQRKIADYLLSLINLITLHLRNSIYIFV